MRQKLIQEVMFIFFIFVFSIVKSEGPKVKLIKIKEFSSYEEYERWKGNEPKREQQRIKIEGNTIKFYNENGELIKKKIFKKYDEEMANKIRKEKRNETAEIEWETANIVANGERVILKKGRDYGIKGSTLDSCEIYDKEGNLRNRIEDNVELIVSPDNKYFVGYYADESGMYGDIKFFDIDGNLLNKHSVFDFDGFHKIVFSKDSKYVAISRDGVSKGGIAVFNNTGVLLWKKIEINWHVRNLIFSPSADMIFAFVAIWRAEIKSSKLKIYAFNTKDGQEIWNSNFEKHILDTEIFNNKIVVLEGRDKVHILNMENGELLKTITLPILNKYSDPFDKFLYITNNSIFIKIIPEDLKEIIFIISWDGEILGMQEILKDNFKSKINLTPEENGFAVIKENKVELYKFNK